MFSNPRGYALIINNESFVNDIYKYRSGSTIDANNLDILFEQLGFKVSQKKKVRAETALKIIFIICTHKLHEYRNPTIFI